jgi:hypothetical protein
MRGNKIEKLYRITRNGRKPFGPALEPARSPKSACSLMRPCLQAANLADPFALASPSPPSRPVSTSATPSKPTRPSDAETAQQGARSSFASQQKASHPLFGHRRMGPACHRSPLALFFPSRGHNKIGVGESLSPTIQSKTVSRGHWDARHAIVPMPTPKPRALPWPSRSVRDVAVARRGSATTVPSLTTFDSKLETPTHALPPCHPKTLLQITPIISTCPTCHIHRPP